MFPREVQRGGLEFQGRVRMYPSRDGCIICFSTGSLSRRWMNVEKMNHSPVNKPGAGDMAELTLKRSVAHRGDILRSHLISSS